MSLQKVLATDKLLGADDHILFYVSVNNYTSNTFYFNDDVSPITQEPSFTLSSNALSESIPLRMGAGYKQTSVKSGGKAKLILLLNAGALIKALGKDAKPEMQTVKGFLAFGDFKLIFKSTYAPFEIDVKKAANFKVSFTDPNDSFTTAATLKD